MSTRPGPDVVMIDGFDPEGEPRIRWRGTDIQIKFSVFPPSWCSDDEFPLGGPFAKFDQVLSAVIELPVVWDDREIFLIYNARPDTIDRLIAFLESYRSRNESTPGPVSA